MFRGIMVFISFMLTTSLAIASHPADGLTPRQDPGYNNYIGDSLWSQGELQFYSVDQRVPYDSLSDSEFYMASGAYRPDGMFEIPWRIRVLTLVDAYFRQYGSLPAVFDDAAIRTIAGREHATDAELAWYRSPVSGEWPQLTNPAAIPGNIYVHPLSTPEKVYLSQFNEGWKRSWFHDLEFSKELYDQGNDWYDCFTKVNPIVGEIWYFRIYGENGVLMAGTNYSR